MKSLAVATIACTVSACQPTAPAPTLTELMIAPVKAPTPVPTQQPLAFGFKVGETILFTEDLTVKTVQTAPVPLGVGATYVLSYYKGRLHKAAAVDQINDAKSKALANSL